MKHSRRILVTLAVFTVIAIPAAAQQTDEEKAEAQRERSIASLIMAIESDNAGLQESAACVLGELKSTEAVIPLMKLLHEGRSESTRIAAALALSRIGEARGAFAVRQAAKTDDSPKVRTLAAWFYNEYYQPGSFAFVPSESGDTRTVAEK